MQLKRAVPQGSFAEYLKVESDLAFKVPEGVSSRDASSYGVPFTTAMQVRPARRDL